MPGLDPGIHPSSRKFFEEDGSPGQGPAMTISIGMRLLAITANTTRFHRPHFELDSKAARLRAATGDRRLSVIRIRKRQFRLPAFESGRSMSMRVRSGGGWISSGDNEHIFIKNNGGNA
jgi:hypothetical protein